MENSWHHHHHQQQQQQQQFPIGVSASSSSAHCSTTLQSTTPPPLQVNFPQAEMNSSNKAPSRSIIQGRIQDTVFYNAPNSTSYKSGHTDLGSSYLALLSGPPSLFQYDFRELADQTQLTTASSNLPVDNGLNSVVGNGLKVPPSHNTSKPKPQNSINLCSVVPSRYATSSTNNISALHNDDQMAQPNSQNSDIARRIQLTVPCDGKTKDTSTGHGIWQSNPAPSVELHHRNTESSRKLPLEINSLVSSQSSVFKSGCPPVFCMGKSGDLLMSNTGLLGVVCSCHSLHMSITKFCEHSGLHDVNPGDAVLMIGGETISQWRKIYFGKLGGRILVLKILS